MGKQRRGRGAHHRRHHQGRTTPRGTRPSHVQPASSHDPSSELPLRGALSEASFEPADMLDPLLSAIRLGGDEILAEADALRAEVWASHLLASFHAGRARAELDGMERPPFEEALLEACRRDRSPEALAVATSLAAVAPPPLDESAATTAEALRASGPSAPAWLDTVGTGRFVSMWRGTDHLGAQDVLIAGVEHVDSGRHGLVVLVDHDLGGQAKDLWIAPDLEEVVEEWRAAGGAEISLRALPLEEGLARLHDAMIASDLRSGDATVRTPELGELRALVWSWLRSAGREQPAGPELADVDSPVGRDTIAISTRPTEPPRSEAVRDAPSAVHDSAAAAPVLARFDALAAFYGDGRKLTQKGNPRLADARELVDLLDLDDQMDPVVGDKTFKTRSAADLPQLRFLLDWALDAGVVRKAHGRLLATKTWQQTAGEPLRRFVRTVEVLERHGPLSLWSRGTWPLFQSMAELVDSFVPAVLAHLVAEPAPFDGALDRLCEVADEALEWPGHWDDPELRRRFFGHDLDHLVMILGWAGILTRDGAEEVPDDALAGETRLVGGTLSLTPAGRWLLKTG